MSGSFLPQRSPQRRRLSTWRARWQRAWRRHHGRRWLLAAPALLLLAVPLLSPPGLSEQELARAWELAGRIGVVVVTALIGRAMLNQGR